jgi:large subunit ribosomal protein L25
MEMVQLSAARRDEIPANRLRMKGMVPAIVYGNLENTQVQCAENALKKAYIKAGESTLVELELDGKKVPVLFHELAFDPVSDRMIHVDFYAVDMKKEIEAEIPVLLTGEAHAVKELSAILVTPTHTVTVRCLPMDLPHDLPVDLSKLTEFGSTITVADLVAPNGVTIVTDAETVLVIAQQPREEEVAEAPVAADGTAPAEGAAPADGAPAAEGAATPEAKKEKE